MATVSVDNITSDDVINAAESGQTITLTGTVTGELSAGDVITTSINGQTYAGAVDTNGTTWTIGHVAGSDLAGDTTFTVTATGSDDAGNPISVTGDSIHRVDTSVVATVSVDNITSDDVVNAVEAGQTITLTGTVTGELSAGDVITTSINGQTYAGAVDTNGTTWTISHVAGSDLAGDTTFAVTATGSDDAGNPISVTGDSIHRVDTNVVATVSVDNITSDDVINAAESGQTITLTGTVTGELSAGDVITTSINGQTYAGAVDTNGTTWTITDVAGSDLQNDLEFTVTATGSDDAGNPISVTGDSIHRVDTSVVATVSVDNITSDDVINAAESGQTITLTGTVTGELSAGDVITTSINGQTYAGAVDTNGTTWTISHVAGSDLAGDTTFTVTATGSDDAGNPISVTGDSIHRVDTNVVATVSVDNITSDDVINGAESGQTITLTGTVTGELSAGDVITTSINGQAYAGTVDANGTTWTITDVAGSDLQNDLEFTVTATGSDDAGNPISVTGDSIHRVDTSVVATVSVDNITSDDVINAAESGQTITLTGTVTGELSAGDVITTSINGQTYAGAVDTNGTTWTISHVAGSDLAGDTTFTVTATGSDDAGNPISVTGDSIHRVDTNVVATVSVDNITSDDVINAAESGQTITLTGTVTGELSAGDVITTSINGQAYAGSG